MKSFSFSYTQNGPLPQSQPLRVYLVDAETGQEVSQSAAVHIHPSVSWLNVIPEHGRTVVNATVELTDLAKTLNVGNHLGAVEVIADSSEASDSPRIAPVSLEVIASEPPPEPEPEPEQNIKLSTTFMKFLYLKPGNLPPQQAFIISTEAVQRRSTKAAISIELYSSVDWLAVTPAYGTTPLTANVKLKNDAKKLSPGIYPAQVEVRSVEAVNSPEFLTVNLEVVNK